MLQREGDLVIRDLAWCSFAEYQLAECMPSCTVKFQTISVHASVETNFVILLSLAQVHVMKFVVALTFGWLLG